MMVGSRFAGTGGAFGIRGPLLALSCPTSWVAVSTALPEIIPTTSNVFRRAIRRGSASEVVLSGVARGGHCPHGTLPLPARWVPFAAAAATSHGAGPSRRGRSPPSDATRSARSQSTGRAPSLPEVCAPSPHREEGPSSPPPSPPPSPKPFGDPSRRPRSELCVVPRSQEIDATEARPASCALVALVGGIRPAVSPLQVGMLLEEFFSVQHAEYTVYRFEPEDFLVEFTSAAVADRILHAHYPAKAPFQLIWKRWRRQAMASFASLRFRVLIEFRGIPAHARNITTATILLDTSCSDLVEAPPELVGDDRKKFFVCAWCIHPDLVPQEKMIFIQEPPEQYVETGLFLRPHEIIHSKHDGLWYRVHIRIVELQDWNLSSDSSDDGTPPDNFDNDEDEYPGFEQRCHSKPWPKRTRFDDGAGSSADPQLGPGWGPPFRSRGQTLGSSQRKGPWGSCSSSRAVHGGDGAMPMVRTVPVTAGSMSLKLPLRFGRCSPVRGVLEQHHATGAPRTCQAWPVSLHLHHAPCPRLLSPWSLNLLGGNVHKPAASDKREKTCVFCLASP
ncbi:hypothetical protein PVAP13_6KG412100 [Panicum virgatum]|uniref:Uncharacterized protein n=1 Tax=Panicum virgatum TaxID=38727 RepID=A0A8T0R9H6_PANVG|nr:hypothetical protein PVAP13_6KG412100 [Panicum virgatum]